MQALRNLVGIRRRAPDGASERYERDLAAWALQGRAALRSLARQLREIRDHLAVARTEREAEAARLAGVEGSLTTIKASTTQIVSQLAAIQDSVLLLRANLYASGAITTMNLKARRLEAAFEEISGATPDDAIVVEIGTMRYPFESPLEGASTLHLARWCREAGRGFISVDISRANLAIARHILAASHEAADLVCADGARFLASVRRPIALLYLDGSNDPGETLAQFEAALPRLAEGVLVVVDDAQETETDQLGKATRVVPYARNSGWDVSVVDTEPGFRMALLRCSSARGNS